MKTKTILASFLALALLGIGGIGPAQAEKPLFPKLVVFGESTSDIGNTWSLTGRELWDPIADPALPTAPNPPLYDSGRWSNGPMWVEILSELLGARGKMRPSWDNGLNYAYTDSRIGDGYNPRFSVWSPDVLPEPLVPSIGEQIRMHEAKKSAINAKHLVVLWVGANDIFLAADGADIFAAVEGLGDHVRALVDLGAQHILVPNQIDASGAPYFADTEDMDNAAIRAAISAATQGFNALLGAKLAALKVEFGDSVQLYNLDFAAVGEALACGAFGTFYNFTQPAALVYLESLVTAEPKEIDDPVFDTFVFWDTIHPTRIMHALLAQAAASFITTGAVPIPPCAESP